MPLGAPGIHLSEILQPAAADKRHFWEDEDLIPDQHLSGHQVLCPKGYACIQLSAWDGPFLCLPKAGLLSLPSSPPSHSLKPVGKEVFSLPEKRTDN